MDVMIRKLIAQISFWMLRILDGMMQLFRAFAGLDANITTADGAEGKDIFSVFFDNRSVQRAGLFIMLICVAVLGIFAIIAVVKTMTTTKKTQGKVVGQVCAALAAFLIVQAVLVAGIAVSNQVLRLVDGVTSQSNSELSQDIFDLAVKDGYRGDANKSYFHAWDTPDKVFGKYEPDIISLEKKPGGYQLEVVEIFEIDEVTGEKVLDVNGQPIRLGTIEEWHEPSKSTYIKSSGGIADLYETNLFILFFTPLILILIIGIALLKLTRRIFNIIMLYLCAPFFISSIPLDDGSRFKLWRENTVSTTLSIYGTVVAFNLFLLAVGIIRTLQMGSVGGFMDTVFKLLLIIGAAFTASGGADFFASMLGGQQQQHNNLGQMIYSGMQGMALGGAIGGGAMRILTGRRRGGRGGGGQEASGGAVGGLLGAARGAANFGGRVLFGNRYEGKKFSASQNYQRLKNTLQGKANEPKQAFNANSTNQFMRHGGVFGGAAATVRKWARGKGDLQSGMDNFKNT